jgi:hypothetical protein
MVQDHLDALQETPAILAVGTTDAHALIRWTGSNCQILNAEGAAGDQSWRVAVHRLNRV